MPEYQDQMGNNSRYKTPQNKRNFSQDYNLNYNPNMSIPAFMPMPQMIPMQGMPPAIPIPTTGQMPQ